MSDMNMFGQQGNADRQPLALIVDDDAMLRLLAVSALKKAGFATCEAADGDQALEQFELCAPDVLLLDIEMPGRDGFSVCEALRASKAGHHTPILMMTSHEDALSVDRAYHAGATDFISKPVNWNLLGHRVRYLLRNATLFMTAEKQRQRLEEAEEMAGLGSWRWNFATGELCCSNGVWRLFGMSGDGCITMDDYLTHVIEKERPKAADFMAAYPGLAKPKPFEMLQRIRNNQGEELILQLRGCPHFDRHGKAEYAEGTLHDVSKMMQLEEEKRAIHEQLEHAQRMESLGIMTGGIAHDFNNMLAAIISNLYLTKMMARGNDVLENKLATIEDICNRAAAIIRAMLTFARNDHVRKTVIDMGEMMEESCVMLQSGTPATITLKTTIADVPMPCLMNKTQLQQVLMNLVNNARFAVVEAAEPLIELSVSPFVPAESDTPKARQLSQHKWLRMQVRDNGVGIEAAYLDKIFDPFFTTREVGEGTGLGLSMAYGAVESHGGFIDVQSQPGCGALFSVYLPMSMVEGGAAKHQPVASTATGSGETILIVDDNEELRLSTCSVLNKLGYKTIEASNGKEGIATYDHHKEHVSLILMDVVMPVLGGISAAQEIRRKNRQIPIVFITGYDLNSAMVKEINIQNSQVVCKPFTMQGLNQLIVELLHPAE